MEHIKALSQAGNGRSVTWRPLSDSPKEAYLAVKQTDGGWGMDMAVHVSEMDGIDGLHTGSWPARKQATNGG